MRNINRREFIGAEPYLAANLRSLPAKDFYEWVEYCNAPAALTTNSRMRAAAGDTAPFNIRYKADDDGWRK